MTDYFALLKERRRPGLIPGSLRKKFLALSTLLHPDRAHHEGEAASRAATGEFSELNAAYQCLLEPKDRVRHLLELELGVRPPDIQRIPPELGEAFLEVGRICREADGLLAEKAKTSSPLIKVVIFERGLDQTVRLQELQARILAQREELFSELKALNPAWEGKAASPPASTSASPLERLLEIQQLLGYFGRWLGQIQERIVQLAV